MDRDLYKKLRENELRLYSLHGRFEILKELAGLIEEKIKELELEAKKEADMAQEFFNDFYKDLYETHLRDSKPN